ncbi:potassium-transporting ATPase subunit C [Paraburkholderia sp. RL17-337-BIB-A]|uniref:potassium-transporting ATPase subunit C n=1 Tax=Paraburkholderia sp. RL17-337-BIB-A TaxID=3031636 RepID=UPI0038B9035C
MKTLLRPLMVLCNLTTEITGVIYPIVVNATGYAAFAAQANGSLLEKNGKGVGSALKPMH